ncbi:MAG: sulfatase-like hydrolase/transferase [bacterium]
MKRVLRLLFPLIFAIFPVIALYAGNIIEVTSEEIIRSLVISIGAVIILWGLLYLVIRRADKVSIITSLFFLWFFSYQHVIGWLRTVYIAKQIIEYNPIIPLTFWVIILLIPVIPLLRTAKKLDVMVNFAWIFGIALIIPPTLMTLKVTYGRVSKPAVVQAEGPELNAKVRVKVLPNIYHIILDAYGRNDILNDVYKYDNADFTNFLHVNDFQLATNSSTNYCQTLLVMSSMLNYDYLQDMVPTKIPPKSADRLPLKELIDYNRVFATLKNHGYTTITFKSAYDWLGIKNADYYIAEKDDKINNFETKLLQSTPISAGISEKNKSVITSYKQHRHTILYTLDYLSHTTKFKAPIYVYAHILSPHPPFVFYQDGSPRNPDREFAIEDGKDFQKVGGSYEEYLAYYKEQVIFINRKVEAMVKSILARSTRPTIIIIQSDHGPGSHMDWINPDKSAIQERLRNMVAIRAPKEYNIVVPDDLQPVNEYRLIFNSLFDVNLPMLPHHSYFSTWDEPYNFNDYQTVVDEKKIIK